MTYSNPAGSAPQAAGAYVRALLDLLGPRDPLEVMAELLPWLETRLLDLTEPVLRKPEAPGKWSVIQVVQHLADSELVAGYRIRMIVAEDRPPLQGYDQDRWAREFHYDQIASRAALDQLRSFREANLQLWSRLTLVHRRQIDRVLAAVR